MTKSRNAASSIANDLRRVDDIQQQQQSKQTPGESDDINSKEQPKPQQDELVSSSTTTTTTTKTDKNSISASENPFENLAPSELNPTTANGDVINGNGEEEKENGDDESLEGIRRRRLQHFGSTSSQQQSAQ